MRWIAAFLIVIRNGSRSPHKASWTSGGDQCDGQSIDRGYAWPAEYFHKGLSVFTSGGGTLCATAL